MATPNFSSNEAPHLKELTQEIYKHSLELAAVNKSLSLLRKLYQISLLTLDPPTLSAKISETVRVDLNMEMVGVYLFDEEDDAFKPLAFSKSERLFDSLVRLQFLFSQLEIEHVAQNPLLQQVIGEKRGVLTTHLEEVWHDPELSPKLSTLSQESHINTVLLYPLLAEDRIIGVVLFGLNRNYKTFTEHEKDTIIGLIDVIAVALDKAKLYEQLKATNEQLKVLDQARSEFITIASHQLRTPPATIKWYLASIIEGDFGEISKEAKQQLIKVQTTNNSLIALIDDLLNVSRIERGKLEFVFQETDLEALTQMTVDQLIPQAQSKNIDLVFKKPTKPLPRFTADPEKLRQVINNLIDNAIKYTKEGSVKIEIGQDQNNYFFKVTDSGKGIAPHQIDGIFKKFDRGKEAAKNSTGLGLGLYVGKVVIEQHNGKIWAESAGEGKGSTFIFTIPIKNTLESTVFDLTKGKKQEKAPK